MNGAIDTHTEAAEGVKVAATHLSRETERDPAEVARCIVNLVSQQGSGTVCVHPADLIDPTAQELAAMDPDGRWADWWARLSGGPLVLDREEPRASPLPGYGLRSSKDLDHCLGINFGGHYLRTAWLVSGEVAFTESHSLAGAGSAPGAALRLKDVLDLLPRPGRLGPVRYVGVAWSAPRGSTGLCSMSLPMQRSRELGAAMDAGTIDTAIAELYGCPVYSWNDGEAAVAAEAGDAGSHSPLVALKLGTSVASGMYADGAISSLPFQLSKAILKSSEGAAADRHPTIGLPNTLREHVGAASLIRKYRSLKQKPDLTYTDLCAAVAGGEGTARKLFQNAADAIVEVITDVAASWGRLDLVLTGKNVESFAVREVLTRRIKQHNDFTAVVSALRASKWDTDLSTAIGACILSLNLLSRC